jgi:hypothetical protein
MLFRLPITSINIMPSCIARWFAAIRTIHLTHIVEAFTQFAQPAHGIFLATRSALNLFT